MIRISTTTLESFRRVVETEYGNEAELVAQVMGKPFTPSWQMQAGTEFDRALEGQMADERLSIDLFKYGKFYFSNDAIMEGINLCGRGLWQVKAVKIIDIAGCPVQIVAKADHVRGLLIQDNKTRWGKLDDARDREASLQWRFYLWVHGAALFRYNIFEFKEPDGGGYCELKGTTTYNFWPYSSLEQDCRVWVSRFLDWAHSRKVTEYLDRPSSGLEAA